LFICLFVYFFYFILFYTIIKIAILSSSASSLQMNSKFEQRLNLFQLTNLVFGGTDHVPSPLSTKRSNKREVNSDLSDFFSTSIPYFCRKHRLPNCNQSDCLSQKPKGKANPRNPGLLEAIPTFLKISASMLRSVLDGDGDVKPLTVAGQQVMGGGMPPRWYDLFLELLTQAVIQCYLCDGHTGPETVSDAFSYGYVEDEDEEEDADDVDDADDADDADDEEDDDEEEESLDNRDIKAADHHLLFPKTRTMYLFKVQVCEREKEVKKKSLILFTPPP
jgi:hypothetical protein